MFAEVDLPCFVAGNPGLDEALETSKDVLDIIFFEILREVAHIETDHW